MLGIRTGFFLFAKRWVALKKLNVCRIKVHTSLLSHLVCTANFFQKPYLAPEKQGF